MKYHIWEQRSDGHGVKRILHTGLSESVAKATVETLRAIAKADAKVHEVRYGYEAEVTP